MCKVSIDIWNKYVDKNNNEINAEAKDEDIVIKHNGLLFYYKQKMVIIMLLFLEKMKILPIQD